MQTPQKENNKTYITLMTAPETTEFMILQEDGA